MANEIKTAVLNKHELFRVCNANGVQLKVVEGDKFKFILFHDGKNKGLINCFPSNNGKYYAVPYGVKNDYFVAGPAFKTFERALEATMNHIVSNNI